jgi:hypothetical protein
MLIEAPLKRAMSALDLALAAGKKRLSPRTRMVHLFHTEADSSDTVPLYENFCYALALCSLRKAEAILEAKELLLRLLPFQTEEGNFPIYLHDYPQCYDPTVALKIGPLLVRFLRDFSQVLGTETKSKLEACLKKIISFSAHRCPDKPLWQFRYQILCALHQNETPLLPPLDTSLFSPLDWWEYWITLQFIQTPRCDHFHPSLLAYVGPNFSDSQTHFEPTPQLIEWMGADALGTFSPRLLKDDPRQIQLIALEKLELSPLPSSTHHFSVGDSLRFLWGTTHLHTLVLLKKKFQLSPLSASEFILTLPQDLEIAREDLFECALYCDASSDTTLWIDGERGTVFNLGETVEIRSADFTAKLRFELHFGEGQFCGHIHFGNRPSQIGATGANQYQAFDWKIGLRTLRRSSDCSLKLTLTIA